MNTPLLVSNFRDVGETINILVDREVMNGRTLLRGGSIDSIDDLGQIHSPRTIINLRKGGNRDYESATTHHCPAPDSVDVYNVEAGRNRKWIISVLKILAGKSVRPPFYVHCAAGKDRTGVIVAAILSAVGIEKEIITQDYDLSAGELHHDLFALSLIRFEYADYFRKVDIESLRSKILKS